MSFFRGPNIVKDSLVLYLDAANKKSYPGTGTTAYDLISNNTATLDNSDMGLINPGSFTFNGSNSISFTNPLKQSPENQQWTVEAWVKMEGVNDSQYLIKGWNSGLSLEHSSRNKPINYLNSGDNDSYAYGKSGDFQSGIWTMATFAFDRVTTPSGRVSIRQNIETPSFGTNVTATDLPSGIHTNLLLGDLLVGNIAILKIYNRYITDDETLRNFNATKNRFGI